MLLLLSVVGQRCQPLPDVVRLLPLLLFLVQLLEIEQGVLVAAVESQHLGERLQGTVHESAASEVEAETQQHVGLLELGQLG